MKIEWNSPGPVSGAFMDARNDVDALMGPIGAGKTTTNLFKHMTLATEGLPSPADGVRRYRLGVVRDTYRELWSSTIPSWWKRVPPDTGEWTGGHDQPAVHRIRFDDGRGLIEYEVWFRAIGEQAVEAALRGVEVTSWYLNEADLLAPGVFIYCRSRMGRFPDKSLHGEPAYYCTTMDFNAPAIDNYLYLLLVEAPPPKFNLFVQPSGFDPQKLLSRCW